MENALRTTTVAQQQ